MLASLGLDPAAEAVYRVMLAHPQLPAGELASQLSLTAAELDLAVSQLAELGLIRPSHDRAGQLRAVSPEIGMEILLAKQMAGLAAEQHRVETSRVAAAQLIAEYAELRPRPEPGVEYLSGLDQIRDRLITLSREVRTEVLSMSPDAVMTPENMDASRPLDEEVCRRGVKARDVVLDSVRNDPATLAYARWSIQIGVLVRTAPAVPTRMIIFDRQTAMLPAHSDNTAAGAVVLTGQGTLTALCALFESVWAGARPLGEPPARDDRGLTGQQATALRLLGAGLTDEAIARQLGVSARTIRRVVGELMEQLGARSRFEAGVRAVQHGWLPPEA